MVDNELIRNLMYTGLSEYEARAYLALLGKNPVTAYELAREAGIPTSKVYEVVSRLEAKGMVGVVGGEPGKKTYVPMDPREFLRDHRTMIEHTFAVLETGLTSIRRPPEVSYIWNLSEYAGLMERAVKMIESAEGTLLGSLWPDESGALEQAMEDAALRGVRIARVFYGRVGSVASKAGQVHLHPIHETVYHEKGGRGLLLVADSREALMATISESEGGGPKRVEGAISTSRGFVTLAEDYIKHDIYMMKVVKRFDPQLKACFGVRYEYLRDVFSDKEKP